MNATPHKGKLPLPRMQLRWERAHCWQCHYELILPLNEFDVRREIFKNGRMLKNKNLHLVVPMGLPTSRSGGEEPCMFMDQSGKVLRFADAPYRDGAHAQWDSALLGGIPVFVIAPDKKAFKVEVQP